jgi:hypothetical protein
MSRFAALAIALSAIGSASAWAQIAERHVVGLTEGSAHHKADAQCRPFGDRARVHMFLNNGLAFECLDPATGVGDNPPGLTWGPL